MKDSRCNVIPGLHERWKFIKSIVALGSHRWGAKYFWSIITLWLSNGVRSASWSDTVLLKRLAVHTQLKIAGELVTAELYFTIAFMHPGSVCLWNWVIRVMYSPPAWSSLIYMGNTKIIKHYWTEVNKYVSNKSLIKNICNATHYYAINLNENRYWIIWTRHMHLSYHTFYRILMESFLVYIQILDSRI